MDNQLPYFYETEVEWTTERQGHLRAPNLPAVEIATPPEFKGHEGFWTPEHLYVAAVNTCFMTTFLAIAELSKLEFVSFRCAATGKLEKAESHGFKITEVVLRPQLVIRHAHDLERAGAHSGKDRSQLPHLEFDQHRSQTRTRNQRRRRKRKLKIK